MASGDYNKLEKSAAFKRDYYSKSKWWVNLLMVPPICLIFIGLLGVIYLTNYEMLVTLYVVPYLFCFFVGMILLRAIKQHIFKAAMMQPNSFLICIARPIAEIDGYVYALFVNGENRHNQYYITNLAKGMTDGDIDPTSRLLARKQCLSLKDEEQQVEYYLRAYRRAYLNKSNLTWEKDNYFNVLFITDKLTPIVKKKDLMDANIK